MVHGGQVVARMDTRDLDASLRQAESQIYQAEHSIAAARAEQDQAASQVKLTAQELERARALRAKRLSDARGGGPAPVAIRCGPRGLHGLPQRRGWRAIAARDAAAHSADVIRINIADSALVAPKDCRSSTGWPMSARCLAPVGVSSLCSTWAMSTWTCSCRPARRGGRTRCRCTDHARRGTARAGPARVVFVASQNQFTPEAGGNQGGARQADVPRARAHRPLIGAGAGGADTCGTSRACVCAG